MLSPRFMRDIRPCKNGSRLPFSVIQKNRKTSRLKCTPPLECWKQRGRRSLICRFIGFQVEVKSSRRRGAHHGGAKTKIPWADMAEVPRSLRVVMKILRAYGGCRPLDTLFSLLRILLHLLLQNYLESVPRRMELLRYTFIGGH